MAKGRGERGLLREAARGVYGGRGRGAGVRSELSSLQEKAKLQSEKNSARIPRLTNAASSRAKTVSKTDDE